MALRLLNGNAATFDMDEPFDTIGEYCLVEFIGRGGMGEVWLGVKQGTTRPRAIKILLPEFARNPASVESFRREAEIGMQLARHDSIVGVHDIHEALIGAPECAERVLYLVLDFVDGVNLRRLSKRYHRANGQRLPVAIVVHIIRAMLRALEAAHSHAIGKDAVPVVHGDINPGNVLVSSRGEVRVTDFGISRFAPEPTFISRPVGTLPYMAPEQYTGRVCPQNDLYSVGAVLHELLTGEPPLPGRGSPRTMERKLLQDPVPALGRDDVPPALERLRRGLLDKNWELRIQTTVVALEILATVGRADCQDELKGIYTRLFGPPRSRLTRYLQAQGSSSGSFVVGLLQHRRRPAPADPVVDREAREAPQPGAPGEPQPSDDAETTADQAMPWLADEDDTLTTEVHRRPATQLSRTIRLDVPVGTVPPVSILSTPTVPKPPPAANEPPVEESFDVATTAPRRAAAKMPDAAETTPSNAGRYPPRPDHLEDGVPFQRLASRRGVTKLHVPVDAPDTDTDASSPTAAIVGDPDRQPARVARKVSPMTRGRHRWLGALCLTMAAAAIVVFGVRWAVSSFADPEPAPSVSPHHARADAKEG